MMYSEGERDGIFRDFLIGLFLVGLLNGVGEGSLAYLHLL